VPVQWTVILGSFGGRLSLSRPASSCFSLRCLRRAALTLVAKWAGCLEPTNPCSPNCRCLAWPPFLLRILRPHPESGGCKASLRAQLTSKARRQSGRSPRQREHSREYSCQASIRRSGGRSSNISPRPRYCLRPSILIARLYHPWPECRSVRVRSVEWLSTTIVH
jgi:hypothetical protein